MGHVAVVRKEADRSKMGQVAALRRDRAGKSKVGWVPELRNGGGWEQSEPGDGAQKGRLTVVGQARRVFIWEETRCHHH